MESEVAHINDKELDQNTEDAINDQIKGEAVFFIFNGKLI